MEEFYERMEKVRISLMKIMPKLNNGLMNPALPDPALNFTLSELRVLYIFKDQKKYKMSEIANTCGIPLPTATHIVDKLVKSNVVKRMLDKNDRRVIFIEFTKKGKKIMGECEAHHKKSFMQLVSILAEEDREKLVKTMEQFASVIEEIGEKLDKAKRKKEGGK